MKGFEGGKSTRVDDLTSETREVFDNPDGTRTAKVAASPVRFKDAAGAWRGFDTRLEEQGDGRLSPKSAPAGDSVADSASASASLASVSTSAGQVALRQPKSADVAAVLAGGDALFEGALGKGVDLRIALRPHGFDSTVVLSEYQSGASTRQEVLEVPKGVTARNGGAGVELVDDAGNIVGEYGSGTAWDSAAQPVEVEVRTRLVGQDGTMVTVENTVDEAWLADRGRSYPVSIDPSFSTTTAGTGAIDTYVQSNIVSTPQSAAASLKTGAVYGDTSVRRRALMKFNLTSLVGANRGVITANLNLAMTYSPSCTARSVAVRSLTAAPTTSTVWSNQPAFGGTLIASPAFAKGYSASCPAGVQAIDIASLVQKWVDGSANNGLAVVAADEADGLAGKYFDSAEGATSPSLTVTYDNLPTNADMVTPVADAKVTTTQPVLTSTAGTDPDGDPLQYWFSVATEPDGLSGQVVASGWAPSTTFTVPPGALVDGESYYWTVYTWDGVFWPQAPPAPRKFTVDLRLGDGGRWPFDEVGPAKVNLTNGNLVVESSSPSFPTVGGSLGLAYTYNSKADPTDGLLGSYYDLSTFTPADHRPVVGDDPELVRRDPSMRFSWGAGSPWSLIQPDNFYVSWTGFLTVKTTGSYNIGVGCDDGAKVTLGGVVRVDKWTACDWVPAFSTAMTLAAGQAYPITVEQWEGTGTASLNLQMKGPGLATGGEDVHPSWLSTKVRTLPTGWSVSADVDGSADLNRVAVTTTAAVFTDTSGASHRYTWDPTKKAWQPPAGEHGVVGKDSAGNITFGDGSGQTFTFRPDGSLASVRSGADDRHPAVQVLTWTGSPARLSSIQDPVSGRSIMLHYSGDAVCSSDPNFVAAPAGVLCAVGYAAFGAGTTQLRYNSLGQLARIEDPGAEQTDFGYTSGLLSSIRDPLANDAIAKGLRTDGAPGLPASTKITYGFGAVTSVELAEPQGGEARPRHDYTYVSSTVTDVAAAGLTSTTGKLQSVIYDGSGRSTQVTDQAGRVSHTAWDTQDRPVTTWDDSTGLKSTTVFDTFGNATDSWGPAPVGWWTSASATGAPLAGNQAATPHETTVFDEGLTTLGATWWPNATFSGAPTAHSTGINTTTQEIYNSWGTGAPSTFASPPAQFSGRITGWVNIATTTPWDFQVSSLVGTFRLYVDSTLILDKAATTASAFTGTYTPASTGWKPITIEYADTASSAGFGLWWRQGAAGFVRVPPASMSAGYGLATTATDATGMVTSTTYSDPARNIDPYLGLATAAVTDAGTGRLNLTATTTYEDANSATGYLRETAQTLAAG
ncbi:MAG: PA14 domain-containing protein, partial [Aquihabitans sp.]